MILRGSYGDTFEIVLLGYQSDSAASNRHDLNWLNVKVSASRPGRDWARVDLSKAGASPPSESWGTVNLSMLTWEVRQLHEWLRSHATDDDDELPLLELVEPEMGFEIVRGDPELLLRVTTRFDLGVGAPDGEVSEAGRVVNLTVSRPALLEAADALRVEASRFPER